MARALQSFTVRAQLPEALSELREIAMNLRWSWDARSQDLFRWADPEVWGAAGGDPMRLLGMIDNGAKVCQRVVHPESPRKSQQPLHRSPRVLEFSEAIIPEDHARLAC